MPFAHSKNPLGQMHDLQTHLTEVAKLAGEFADKFRAAEFGYWAGIWHDLGKFHPDFQAYLANPTPRRGPDHKGAGAVLAARRMEHEPLSFLVAGHHGGLHSRETLKNWLKEKARAPQVEKALQLAQEELSAIEPDSPLIPPNYVRSELESEFFLRMVFSALTDADFIDTERHFNQEKSEKRQGSKTIADLWNPFEVNQRNLTGKKQDRVNLIRHEVYQACLQAAEQSPGFFRLTVPTGGGKTRSSMAFAIRHAITHGLDRAIVAIP